jgi:tetratricopeptide (TPR) repeat protein
MSSGTTVSAAPSTTVSREATLRRPGGTLVAGEKRSIVLCLLLVLLTLTFYNPVVHNRFTNMDDDGYIIDNTHVQAGLTWPTVKWAFTTFDAKNWHPLTWLSHALDCQLFKLNPVGHHYVNVLIHATNVLLLFLLLEIATGFTWPSFVVAALFALHPLNVESVAWASERKNVLSMLFFLLTLHAYGWYARRESVKRYLVVAGLFALGLMAKPEIITLPFVLLLWDYWPLQRMSVLGKNTGHEAAESTVGAPLPRSFGLLCLEKVPLLLLSAGSAVMTLLAQGASVQHDLPLGARLANALVAYVRYLGKTFWPSPLASLYPRPDGLLPLWQVGASFALLLLLTALVLHWRNRRYLAVGWFWFLGTLVPVIGVLQVGAQAIADRYAYLADIGLFICVMWAAAQIVRERKIPAAWAAAPAVVVLITLGMVTSHQIGYWHDSMTLWTHTLSVTGRNPYAHEALAYTFAQRGQSEDAIREFDAAVSMHQYKAIDLVAFAAYKREHGHLREAIEEYTLALAVAGDAKMRAIVLSRLATAYMQSGDYSRAEANCAAALQQNPNNGTALMVSALLAQRQGNFQLAATQFSRAMNVQPTDVGYVLLAQALRRAGRPEEADGALAQAQRISPNLGKVQQAAALVLATADIKGD